jgi:hypothetical protein
MPEIEKREIRDFKKRKEEGTVSRHLTCTAYYGRRILVVL